MSTEEWRLQVSYKLPTGDLINVRANTADELSVNLESIGDYATQIAAVQSKLVGAFVVLPLSTSGSTTDTTHQQSSPAVSASVASVTPTGHVCKHGERKYVSGNGAKGPWAMWACPTAKGATDKCDPDWIKLGS
jgi:hypothetical protein